MTRGLAVVLLVAATLCAFGPIADSGFVDYDDDIYVSANAHIQQPIDAAGVRWALTSFYASNWHPLTWLSHMIDWQLYGMKPLGHHVTSLLLHLANVLVLFFALEGMTGATGRSAFTAALFAVHPLHVESVVWLAERKDLLCALFWFLSIAAYARGTLPSRRIARLAVLPCAVLALMSKPMAVTLPITLLLLDFWPLQPSRSRTATVLVRGKAPLFVLGAAAAWVTVMAQHASRSIATLAELPIDQRLGNAAVAYVTYLAKMFWPVRLAVFYPHPGGTLNPWSLIGAVVVLALITAAAVRLRGTRPYVLFGWLWYVVTLLPVIGLVQVGDQSMADRYTYVPLVGIFIAIVWGAGDVAAAWSARRDRRALHRQTAAAGFAIVLVLVAMTRFQVGFWKDGETLFTRALAVTEGNDVAHAHLGILRGRQGRLGEADAHFREAVRIRPNRAVAHLDLATNLLQLGKTDEALVEIGVALRLDPSDPRIHTNLGGILERRGNLDEARSHFETALRLDPSFTAARKGLGTVLANSGVALAQAGRYDEAYGRFEEAIRVDPLRAETQCDWGVALATQSRYREAAAHLAEAVRLSPTLARAHFSLAAALFFLEDYAGAWREVRLAQGHGFEPPPGFLPMLSAKMPEPR